MSERLILLGIFLTAISGVLGLFFRRDSINGQRLTTWIAVAGASLGLGGAGAFWFLGLSEPITIPWCLPGAEFSVAVDGLSAVFLLPIFLIALLGSVYGLEYWTQTDHPQNGCKLRLFYGILAGGMALVVIARNSIVFLFGWEIMALAAFFLVTTEDESAPVREAGWVYLVAAHVATLCLFALFALLRGATGSFALAPVAESSLSTGAATAIFALALVGFGLKAGIMPLHIWLPSSHAIAPSHVSAIMSGVIIKMGIYGLVRVTSLLPAPPVSWGCIVLALGVVSGVLGVAYAIGQHDLKRLLAYHSIENIGIIVMGLGVALLGRSLGRGDWVLLGLAGSLLHVWNHALFKGLLFLSAGSVIHAVHTREIDHLGGLANSMPQTALCFLIGAVAICGLPPLNGFISEFLIYLGLFGMLDRSQGPSFAGAAFAVPALALVGALALACFVKVYGAVFLGVARSPHAHHANESGPCMIAPMAVLAGCCLFIGLAPQSIAFIFEEAVRAWAPALPAKTVPLKELAPLNWLSGMGLGLLALLALGGLLLRQRLRAGGFESGPTWGCGYARPTPRMQYTSSSFAQMLVDLFAWALRPREHQPAALPVFPTATKFHSEVPDAVLDEAVAPAFRRGASVLAWFRVLQQGSIQAYILYIVIALIVLFMWR